MGMPEFYTDRTENIQYLNIGQGAPNYNFQTVLSLPISAKAGDAISAIFEVEITNPQSYTVEVCRFLILAQTPTDTLRTLDNQITKAMGNNVTTVMHHETVVGGGGHKFTEDFDGFVNLVLYSDSTAAVSGQQVTIEQGYGHLDVFHFIKEEPPVVVPPDGSITLSAAERQQIVTALDECTAALVTVLALVR
jgi:hypothetical protein